eukprot:3391743-Prymnesium_polylepis.1
MPARSRASSHASMMWAPLSCPSRCVGHQSRGWGTAAVGTKPSRTNVCAMEQPTAIRMGCPGRP